jgi:hypothetical protein
VTERVTQPPRPTNPCQPDPCGRYAQCKNVRGVAACSCLVGYVGVPPNCRPECLIHSECPSNLACINEKCRDPCPGACGAYAECSVIKHNAVCRCQQGYEGDPFSSCRRVTTSKYSTVNCYGMGLANYRVYHPFAISIKKLGKHIRGKQNCLYLMLLVLCMKLFK